MAPKIPDNERFQESKRIASKSEPLHLRGNLPGERTAKGEVISERVTVKDSNPAHPPREIELKKKLAEGGEGSVFTTSLSGFVAKIYRRDRLTTDRRDKITLMTSKEIDCETGICFPEALVLNNCGEFVGYLMRQADGYELGRSVFQPKLLLQRFPNWTRRETIQLCLTILKNIKYLNDRNVILGDINPGNILVKSPTQVYFVDCDSYQVEGYPCPVGTVNFTPPEAQKWDSYKTHLRTQQMENFAIATLLFMIMLPGKPPYSAIGGEDQSKNIINGQFPYPLTEDTDKTPPGKWGFIWSHMSYKTKEAFFQTFKKGEKHFSPANRYNANDWIEIFKTYQHGLDMMIENDPMAADIFPTRKKGDFVVEHRKCKRCGRQFPITKSYKDWEQRKTREQGNPVRKEVCDDCKKKPKSYSGYSSGYGSSYRSGTSSTTRTTSTSYGTGYRSGTSGGQKTTTSYGSGYKSGTSGGQKTTSSYGTGYRSGTAGGQKTSNGSGQTKIVGRGSSVSTASKPSTTTSTQQSTPSKSSKSGVGIFVAVVVAIILLFVMPSMCSNASRYSTGISSSSSKTTSSASASTVQTYQTYRSMFEGLTDEQLAKEQGAMKLGSYPEGKDGSPKPIYWVVSDVGDDYYEFTSVFVIDWMPYNSWSDSSEWFGSEIRSWLNGEFLETAFTEEERAMLLSPDPGDPDAKVTLLTLDGAKAAKFSLTTFATPYAVSHGATEEWDIIDKNNTLLATGCTDWWLRSFEENSWAPIVYGCEYYKETPIGQPCGVVPVIRISANG